MSILSFEETQLQLREILLEGRSLSRVQRSALEVAIFGLGVLQISDCAMNDAVGDDSGLVSHFNKHDFDAVSRGPAPTPP